MGAPELNGLLAVRRCISTIWNDSFIDRECRLLNDLRIDTGVLKAVDLGVIVIEERAGDLSGVAGPGHEVVGT